MPNVWIRRVAQPRYIVPVAGWVGCAFLLKFMVAGIAGHGMITPVADERGQMAVLEMPSIVDDETVRTAATETAPRPATAAAEPAEAGDKLARKNPPGAPI